MFTDNFGRRFTYLRLSITDVCNFRCNYCLPDGYQCDHDRDFLSLEEITRIVKAFALMGTEKIRITGGEPSLRKDLPQIIEICKNTPGIKHVALTTNGFKLSHHIEAWRNAGLDALNVSIDSFDPRQFHAITGHDKLAEILKGLAIAKDLGMKKIKVNTVLMRQYSAKEMTSFLDFVRQTPVTLRFIELMQTGDNSEFFSKQHVSGQEIKENLLEQGWLPIIKDKSAGPAQEFYHPQYQGRLGLIMPYSKDFCNSCNRLRISALGKLHLCLFADAGLSIRDLLTTDDPEPVISEIHNLLHDKKATHFLHDKLTGATKNLAMLGG